MSQRTRAHTTGAAARPTKPAQPANGAKPARATSAEPPTEQAPTTAAAPPLNPDALARALRAMATEIERDPALAQRVAQAISGAPGATPTAPPDAAAAESAAPSIGRSFHPTIVTGVAETLGPGVPDPFALRQRLGEDGLRDALASLRLGSLRAIIRQHGLDPRGGLSKLNDAAKLRAHILAATRKAK